jgi:hypothetical protein
VSHLLSSFEAPPTPIEADQKSVTEQLLKQYVTHGGVSTRKRVLRRQMFEMWLDYLDGEFLPWLPCSDTWGDRPAREAPACQEHIEAR